MVGKVYLIGAGPGDPELLTLKAVRALGEADVVLVDDLVGREVLRFARRARVIEVGKRGGCKSTPQQFIERLMARCARRGRVVARLKGGDPFVFGRGGEEMLALRAAGIDYEVVPGVTAGLGIAAAMDVPVTHRELAHGVTFVSGHLRNGTEPDWRTLALTGTTLVVYMGFARVRHIAAELLAGGMPPCTPAAAVSSGTLPGERRVVTRLARLADDVARAGITSPALLVIGGVVSLARGTAAGLTRRDAA
jgi:uroporphyrin-III C-methyltransferase